MASVLNFPRREAQAIGLIGFAHMLSHLYPLALPVLLALITSDLGLTKLQWGTALAVFAVTTGVLQTPMGLLVERAGGRRVLLFGMLVFSTGIFCVGWLTDSYWALLLFMAITGIGNSVFHPADYSLLSSSVDEERIGRAFSIHSFVGQTGFVLGPLTAGLLGPLIGWRGTLMAIGAVGLGVTAMLLLFGHWITEGRSVKKKAPVMDSLRSLVSSRPVMLFFLFYVGSAMANMGVSQFSVAAFGDMYGLPITTTALALTAYQIGTLVLILPGGLLADRTDQYKGVLIAGFGLSALCVFLPGTGWLPFWLAVGSIFACGAVRGAVNATRSVAVRHAATSLEVGTVFGFVSTGALVGQTIGGPMYGWLFDNFEPNTVFYASAGASLLAMSTVLFSSGTRRPAVAV